MNIRPLSKALQDKATRELNEIPCENEKNLKRLKSWLEKQEHLKYKNDDQFLINFLRGTKFSLERTKEKLDAYYTFRTIAPELSRNLDPFGEDMQIYLKMAVNIPLPTPKNDPAAPRVILFTYADYDPETLSFSTIIKGESMAINVYGNEDDNYIISGAIGVWDLKGLKFKTVVEATPTFIKKLVFCFETAFPTRLKQVFVINVPSYFDPFAKLMKMLVSKKLSKRLHFYSTNNLDAIFKYIPKSIFPNEYGGEAGGIEEMRAAWKVKIESHQEMLVNENNYYSDESKRPGKSHAMKSMFGIEGSFRNLTVD